MLTIEVRRLKDENLVLTERVHGVEQTLKQQMMQYEIEQNHTSAFP